MNTVYHSTLLKNRNIKTKKNPTLQQRRKNGQKEKNENASKIGRTIEEAIK
ncbi:hypothetical protein Sjap_020315 [Stephania japonica]|uniref:Uncharacterized protein n=1 Tax=Stephania japonica TaxID=461633 RepID=A0AAP0F1T9_9MAGN